MLWRDDIERRRKYAREYYRIPINREKNNKRMRSVNNKRADRNRGILLNILGGKCSNTKCLVIGGCTDKRCLQIDHIYGGGKKEIKQFHSTNGMIAFYLKNPNMINDKLQLLCANCNWIKRYENVEVRRKYTEE